MLLLLLQCMLPQAAQRLLVWTSVNSTVYLIVCLSSVPGSWRPCQVWNPLPSFFPLTLAVWWSSSLKGWIGYPLGDRSPPPVFEPIGTLARPRLRWPVLIRSYGNAPPLSVCTHTCMLTGLLSSPRLKKSLKMRQFNPDLKTKLRKSPSWTQTTTSPVSLIDVLSLT